MTDKPEHKLTPCPPWKFRCRCGTELVSDSPDIVAASKDMHAAGWGIIYSGEATAAQPRWPQVCGRCVAAGVPRPAPERGECAP